MNYDVPTKKFILYGGLYVGGERDDYWSYDPARNLWTKLDGLRSPEPREGQSMAYDSQRRVGVLFGGSSTYPEYHDDTWTYDSSANRWERRNPALSPPARRAGAMCYDQDDGVVLLFGGTGHSSTGTLSDTWAYNVSTNAWTERQPAASPPPGEQPVMAYDPANRLAVLFCGPSRSSFNNETWTYDYPANLWTNRTGEIAPPTRRGAAMAYDGAAGLWCSSAAHSTTGTTKLPTQTPGHSTPALSNGPSFRRRAARRPESTILWPPTCLAGTSCSSAATRRISASSSATLALRPGRQCLDRHHAGPDARRKIACRDVLRYRGEGGGAFRRQERHGPAWRHLAPGPGRRPALGTYASARRIPEAQLISGPSGGTPPSRPARE